MKHLKGFVAVIVITFGFVMGLALTHNVDAVASNRYYYSKISNSNTADVYNILANSIENNKKIAIIPTNDTNKINDVLNYISLDYPEFIRFDDSVNVAPVGNKSIVFLQYNNIDESIAINKANDIASILKSLPEDNRISTLYRMLMDITYSSNDNMDFNMYGALINGKAACEGYAETFSYILTQLGYENHMISGLVGGMNHRWNAVKIDGTWYEFDATFDATDHNANLDYFKVSSAH